MKLANQVVSLTFSVYGIRKPYSRQQTKPSLNHFATAAVNYWNKLFWNVIKFILLLLSFASKSLFLGNLKAEMNWELILFRDNIDCLLFAACLCWVEDNSGGTTIKPLRKQEAGIKGVGWLCVWTNVDIWREVPMSETDLAVETVLLWTLSHMSP